MPETAPVRVLVAEDEADMADLMGVLLEEEFDHVDIVTDGEAALEALNDPDRRYAVAMIDWMMPKADGLDVLKHVRGTPRLADLAVIVLTAHSGPAEKVKGYEAGADAYMSKPFDPDELIELAHKLLATSPGDRVEAREAAIREHGDRHSA